MRSPIIRSGRVWAYVIIFLLSPLFVSCDIADERELCCEEVTIHFRYSKGAIDEFPLFIKKMDYFIFDAGGHLLHHLSRQEADGDLQLLRFRNIDAGRYQILAVGNASELSLLTPIEVGALTLPEFRLRLSRLMYSQSGAMVDSDPLYYGQLSFEVEPLESSQRFLCDMSNVHCRLIATVRWADTQPEHRQTPFRLELIGVPSCYHLSNSYPILVAGDGVPVSSTHRVVHSFPHVLHDGTHHLVEHYKEAPYLAGRVRGELRTLRYTDQLIPSLRITQGGREVMRPIPLERVFRDFKWTVSFNVEQVYELEFTIYDDGRVEVRSGGQMKILDWINGGVV